MTKPRLRWRKFGRDLRQIRTEFDYSVRKAARMNKINHSTYVRAEKGRTVEAAYFMRLCCLNNLEPMDYVP